METRVLIVFMGKSGVWCWTEASGICGTVFGGLGFHLHARRLLPRRALVQRAQRVEERPACFWETVRLVDLGWWVVARQTQGLTVEGRWV